jgi:hypothetical protein
VSEPRELTFSYQVSEKHGLPRVNLFVSNGKRAKTIYSAFPNTEFIRGVEECAWMLVTDALERACAEPVYDSED